MPVSQVQHSNAKRIRLENRMAEDSQESPASEVYRVEERPEHGMKILQGLNKLKNDKILCDVTLIAEGEKEMMIMFFLKKERKNLVMFFF